MRGRWALPRKQILTFDRCPLWLAFRALSWKTDHILGFSPSPSHSLLQYGIKKKEEREAEAQAALEANSEGSLTRPKKAIPPGCGDEDEEEEESILDTVIKYLPGPLQDMFKK